MTVDSLTRWFLTPAFANDTLVNNADLKLTDAFNLEQPNLIPLSGSPLLGNADFSDPDLQNSFFTVETFIGAFGSTDWTAGWAVWDPQNLPYGSK